MVFLIRKYLNLSFHYAEELYTEFNIGPNEELNFSAIINFYESLINNLLPIGSYYFTYNETKTKIFPWLNLVTYSIYLLGWCYILYTSNYIFPTDYFDGLRGMVIIEEPFSGCEVIADDIFSK